MQKIDATTAAHNVATAFIQQFAKNLTSSSAFDLNNPNFYNSANVAAQIYANVYDSVFEHITAENNALNEESVS